MNCLHRGGSKNKDFSEAKNKGAETANKGADTAARKGARKGAPPELLLSGVEEAAAGGGGGGGGERIAAAPSLLLAQSRGPTASDAASPSLAALNRTSVRRLTRSFLFAARSWSHPIRYLFYKIHF